MSATPTPEELFEVERLKFGNLITRIFGSAVLKQLEVTKRNYTVGADVYWEDDSELDKSIESEYLFTVNRVEQRRGGENLYVVLEFTGKLRDAFESREIPWEVLVCIDNNTGDDNITFTNKDDLQFIRSSRIEFFFFRDEEKNKKFEELNEFLLKHYLFKLIDG
jgi:hypothetical protein